MSPNYSANDKYQIFRAGAWGDFENATTAALNESDKTSMQAPDRNEARAKCLMACAAARAKYHRVTRAALRDLLGA